MWRAICVDRVDLPSPPTRMKRGGVIEYGYTLFYDESLSGTSGGAV